MATGRCLWSNPKPVNDLQTPSAKHKDATSCIHTQAPKRAEAYSNGLCLSALHDRAYDQGLITVLPDYTIRVTEHLRRPELDEFAQTTLAQCHGQAVRLPERFRPAPEFLEAHVRRFGFL